MHFLLPPFMRDHLVEIYILCAAWYLLHFLLAWRFWPTPLKSDEWRHKNVHFWTQTSLAWRLTADGVTRLSRGMVVLLVAIGFVPFLNMALAYFDLFFTLMHVAFLLYLRIRGSVVGAWLREDAHLVQTEANPPPERIEPYLRGDQP